MRRLPRAIEALVLVGSTILVACTLPRRTSETNSQQAYAAIVDAGYEGTEGEPASGVRHYRSIGGALASLPGNYPGRAVIFIRNGRYREKLSVDRPRVTLLGESREGTIITYDAIADTPAPGGGTYGTRGSYTVRIAAPDFVAENLTIENAFDYNTNFRKRDDDPSKIRNAQGVALMTGAGSDRASFINVRILGHQDTLFANAGRSFFAGCEIRGNVDFIFGAGQAVFANCDIVSLDRGSNTNNGYITAASTSDKAPYGFLFWRSRLKKESPSMAPHTVTLGRPWHPFADPHAWGSVAFVDCWMDDHIGSKGWDRMSSVDSTGVRIWYELESGRFFEFGSAGPGAVSSSTRRLLSEEDVRNFTPENVLDGWVPPHAGDAYVSWAAPDSAGGEGSSGQARTLEDMFVGKFPGLEVIRLPSGGITFRIRGVGTILGNGEPLIILDGMELLNGGGGLLFLGPDDIAKIEVLKDVGSTGSYGMRGANGVILITTKRPQ
jgi:pectinesterase